MEAQFARMGTRSGGARPRVYAELWFGRHPRTTGGRTHVHDLIELAGGVNVFGDSAQGYLPLDLPVAAAARPDIVLFRRRIAPGTFYRSAAIAVVAAIVVGAATMLLLASQQGGFESMLFEVVSAFGTVGLSLGATAMLDAFGKVLVAAVMLAGRVGPLTLALLFGRVGEARVGYPEASLMVG
jgi:trk system potassium uptake protein TrkH